MNLNGVSVEMFTAKGTADPKTIPGDNQDPRASIQGTEGANPADDTEGRTESCDKTTKRRQTKKVDAARGTGGCSRKNP